MLRDCSDENNCMKSGMTTTEFEAVSSYVEDDKELNVLFSTKVSPDERLGDPEPRWAVITDPVTRGITRVEFFVATDEGFGYPEYTPSNAQMALFRKFAKECE